MSETSRGEYSIRPNILSPEEAAMIIERQEAICRILDEFPQLSLSDIPSNIVNEVRVHILTCQDRVHHVDGLGSDED